MPLQHFSFHKRKLLLNQNCVSQDPRIPSNGIPGSPKIWKTIPNIFPICFVIFPYFSLFFPIFPYFSLFFPIFPFFNKIKNYFSKKKISKLSLQPIYLNFIKIMGHYFHIFTCFHPLLCYC